MPSIITTTIELPHWKFLSILFTQFHCEVLSGLFTISRYFSIGRVMHFSLSFTYCRFINCCAPLFSLRERWYAQSRDLRKLLYFTFTMLFHARIFSLYLMFHYILTVYMRAVQFIFHISMIVRHYTIRLFDITGAQFRLLRNTCQRKIILMSYSHSWVNILSLEHYFVLHFFSLVLIRGHAH